MRLGVVILVAVAGCGRVGFDALRPAAGDAGPDAASTDGAPAPPLMCDQTVISPGTLSGPGPLAVAVVGDRLAALWIDADDALRGTTWTAAPDGVAVASDGVLLASGPLVGPVWAAGNGDTLLVAATSNTEVVARFLHADLSQAFPITPLGRATSFAGRHPITRARTGRDFVAILLPPNGSGGPVIATIDSGTRSQLQAVPGLAGHGAPSIADDRTGYTVVTELADQFGPGCWSSALDDSFAMAAGPSFLETTQQADCDSSTVTSSAGAGGAGLTWMERDPASSIVELRGSAGENLTASATGEANPGQPVIAATSTGFAVAYRSAQGLRVFDRAGTRTLDPSPALFDLVTWDDDAIVVWTKTGDARPRLTRLCPDH